MNRFMVRYEGTNIIDLLEKNCEITYQSPIMELVFVETELTREQLLNIDGVIKVEVPRIGKLCI